MFSPHDRDTLRRLAAEYAEIASLPVQSEKRKLWLKLNSLSMERPMLLIDQIPWNEMDIDGFLINRVEDPYWRRVETDIRQTIYKFRYFPADMVVNPYICLPRPINNSGWGISAMTSRVITQEADETASSHEYINQLESMDDLEKIKMPVITLDRARESEIEQEARELFSGIIPYRLTGQTMHLGIWDSISMWMGVENCYFALMDDPDMIHALMEKLTAGLIGMIKQMNELELFDIDSNICHCSQTFLYDMPKEGDHALSGNAWAFGLAQLFTSVSPEITDEFEVQYMKRIFPYFGAIYYGCCDRLDDRMDVIAKLPKIRKLSCSPWSHREAFAEKMPYYCVMSNKPNPAFLAEGSLNEDIVRNDIRRTIDAAKRYGRNLELILKDISTVRHKPECLVRWHDIAMEEILR